MNGLDLFSGIGGLTLALEPWVTPVAYCENDKYCQSVLLSRMRTDNLPCVPIWDDIKTLSAHRLVAFPKIDIIYGGFPCQDISVAGNAKGLAGKRSGLFQEIVRLAEEIRPTFVFLENVPAITSRGLDVVLSAFTQLRYDCRWTIVSAAEVGAPHLRKRWFLLATNADSFGVRHESKRKTQRWNGVQGKGKVEFVVNGEKELMADTKCKRQISCKLKRQSRYKEGLSSGPGEIIPNTLCKGLERQRQEPSGTCKKLHNTSYDSRWTIEPDVGRVVDGLQHRSHRIKSLGNAVVPMQAREAFKRLMGLK